MNAPDQLTAEDIRNALLTRAKRYCEARNTSFSAIGIAAMKDSKFLMRVRDGQGFSINTYQKVVEWLDAAERENAA